MEKCEEIFTRSEIFLTREAYFFLLVQICFASQQLLQSCSSFPWFKCEPLYFIQNMQIAAKFYVYDESRMRYNRQRRQIKNIFLQDKIFARVLPMKTEENAKYNTGFGYFFPVFVHHVTLFPIFPVRIPNGSYTMKDSPHNVSLQKLYPHQNSQRILN